MSEQGSIIPTGRQDFDRELGRLEAELILMSGLVEQAIFNALNALKNRDIERSQKVIDEDDHIDKTELEIELYCVELIRREAPMAGDLRRIISALHIAGELERIGDYAEGIAKISLSMGEMPPLKPLIDIPRMAEKATIMLNDSIDSLLNRDMVKAHAVCQADDEVDELYNQVYRELLLFMVQDPETIQRATYLLWVAHDLERIADRATNIAERVIFLVSGKLVEINVSKY